MKPVKTFWKSEFEGVVVNSNCTLNKMRLIEGTEFILAFEWAHFLITLIATQRDHQKITFIMLVVGQYQARWNTN